MPLKAVIFSFRKMRNFSSSPDGSGILRATKVVRRYSGQRETIFKRCEILVAPKAFFYKKLSPFFKVFKS